MRALLGAAVLAAALAAPTARAHEVLHEVDRGRAIAVRAWYSDGEPLAYVAYEIYSPSDPAIPHQKGRTDRSGWLSFVPDAPGAWRVKVIDTTGHGLALTVDAGAAARPPSSPSTAALVLRPLVGVAAIVAVFAVLAAFHRRRRGTP